MDAPTGHYRCPIGAFSGTEPRNIHLYASPQKTSKTQNQAPLTFISTLHREIYRTFLLNLRCIGTAFGK